MDNIDSKDYIRLLEDTLDAEQYNMVAESLETEAGRQALSSQMDVVLNRIESEEVDVLAGNACDDVLAHLQRTIRKKRWKKHLFHAASLLGIFSLGAACAYGFMRHSDEWPVAMQEISVPAGEPPMHLAFQDGTRVVVNCGSSLKFPTKFAGDTRDVYLSGEAYFKVAPDKKHTFRVNMDNTVVNVLGTTFNVRCYEGDSLLSVSLEEGSVRFDSDGVQQMLSPEQILYFNKKSHDIKVVDASGTIRRSTMWKDNIVAFNKANLKDVLETLSRAYGVSYKIEEPDLCNNTFTYTSVRHPDIDSLIADLETISFVQFKRVGNEIEVSAKQ